jgi:hypothetical protein
MRPLIAWLLLCAAGTAHAEVDGHQLLKFQAEAEAVNAEKADANRYRAGFYNGFVNGVLDAVNGKSACFSDCRCELDALVSRHYREHPADLDKPAGPLLAALLEKHHPCRKP